MKIHTLAVAIAIALLAIPLSPRAEDANTTPDLSITGNAELVSDYVFRGLSQAWGHAALQGGGDLTLKNGFAAGFWTSSLSKNSFPGAAAELDIYGSYGASFNEDWSWRVGLIGYLYPGGNLEKARPPLASRSFNTLEANAAITWKWLTLKYNHSLTDYFAIDVEQGYRDDSRGTGYLQLDGTLPFNDSWSLALHTGHTRVSTRLGSPASGGTSSASYSDFSATLKWQFSPHWSASLGATYADNADFYRNTVSFTNSLDTKNVGGARGFVMLQATF